MTQSEQSRKKTMRQRLNALYPDPKTELNFDNEYQLLVAVALSAQCTDRKVNEVTPTLFRAYPDFRALAAADVAEVEAIIRPINYYRTKSRNILAAARAVVERHGGALPREREALLLLPGVGNKTANVVLGELGIEPTFPVDTHIFRLAHRLALSEGKNPDEVERDLRAAFPPEAWRPLHHQFILHGRRICKAQNPMCDVCPLPSVCPAYDVFKAAREARGAGEKNGKKQHGEEKQPAKNAKGRTKRTPNG